jgi:hypothetical protein
MTGRTCVQAFWLVTTMPGGVGSRMTVVLSHVGTEVWIDANIEDCFLSTITLAEMRWGIERLPESKQR